MVVFVAVIGLVATGCGTSRAGYESASYQVVRAVGNCEVRDYPGLTVVQTPMVNGITGSDGSFIRLFRFITGSNQANQKIPMTTPVFMSGGRTNATMAFVMPAKMKTVEVPKPSDDSVSVSEVEPGRFAVLRYSGAPCAKNDSKALEQLRAWMKGEGLKEVSPPVFGYFDPPWTPPFLRRNEVMARIECKPQS